MSELAETDVLPERADLLELPPSKVEALLEEHFQKRGQGKFRVRQALVWLYQKDAVSFDEMTDLPARERAALEEAFLLTAPVLARAEQSTDGTVKHLWQMADGELIESVLIPTPGRITLCISSQAGCAMACTFCATGWSGYRRNLTPGEIVAQFRGARRWAREHGGGAITNIVFMGMGEPLMNRRAVMRSLTLLNKAYKFGARRVTISTVGIVPGILELAERKEQFRLAVSLHAPNHELRLQIVPVEKKYPLPELLDALHKFNAAGHRRITFEYVMIEDVTDKLELAQQLADIVLDFGAHVNLIPYNPIPGPDWKPSSKTRIKAFVAALEARGARTSVRASRGRDIAAACGQLRAEHETKAPKPYLSFIELRGARKAS